MGLLPLLHADLPGQWRELKRELREREGARRGGHDHSALHTSSLPLPALTSNHVKDPARTAGRATVRRCRRVCTVHMHTAAVTAAAHCCDCQIRVVLYILTMPLHVSPAAAEEYRKPSSGQRLYHATTIARLRKYTTIIAAGLKSVESCAGGPVSSESLENSRQSHISTHTGARHPRPLPRTFDHVAGMGWASWADSGSHNRSAAGAPSLGSVASLSCQTRSGACTFRSLHFFCPVRAVRFCWARPLTTGNRCGKADLVEHDLGCVHTSLYQAHVRICCWLLAYVEPARNFTAPSLQNSEASSEGKTCTVREARSSSSPKAAAISFTSSAYSTCGL